MRPDHVQTFILWFPAFLFSATAHEAAHAWAARAGGDPTAARDGQVSLSPWPHVRRSPLGMVVVPALAGLLRGWCLGWASASYDPDWADRHPRRAAAMAAAGPAANLALALAALALVRLGLVLGIFDSPAQATLDTIVVPAVASDPLGAWVFAAHALSVVLMLNVILLVFNLLPLPPLDGASVLTLALPADLARRARRSLAVPGLSLVGLLAAWQLFPALTQPLLGSVLALLYPGQY